MLLSCVGLMLPGMAQAGDALTGALASIPGDAVGVVCVPSVKGLDEAYQQAIVNLGLQDLVPPPMNSLVGLLKQNLPMLEGIDESGMMAVVFMPAPTPFELMAKQALLIPVKDPKAIIETMGGVAGEEGLWAVDMMGQTAHVAMGKNQLIMAQMPDVAKAIKNSQASLGSKLEATDLKALGGLDLFLWVDAERLLTMLRPMLEGLMAPAMAMQQSAGGFQAKSAELNKQNLDMMFDGLRTMTVGASLDGAGVGLRFIMTTRPGTEFAKQVQLTNTSDSLLQGLPGGDYLMVLGETWSAAQSQSAMKNLEPMMAMGQDVEGVDPEKLGRLKGLLEEVVPLLTNVRVVIEPLAPGSADGLIGLGALIGTTDSAKLLDLKGKLVELAMEMLADAAAKLEDEELGQLKEALVYQREAEQIAGAPVQHVGLDLSKVEDIEEEDREDVLKVIGKDGLLFRLAPADPKTVVVAFGGGQERMAAWLKQAREGGAPLEADAGIKKVSPHLPKERAQVMYVAADRALTVVNNVMTALEEERLPVQIPPVNAPLAMTTCGGDGWMRFDMFAPTELLVASKNAAMMMMTAPSPPAGEPTTTEEPTPTEEP
jgi:hypothetical protein